MTGSFDFSDAQRALLEQLLADAELIEAGVQPIPRCTDDGPAPLSFAQERFWFLNQLGEDNAAYNMTPALRLRGLLNVSALRQALEQLLQCHPILHTIYTTVDGTPMQQICSGQALSFSVIDVADDDIAARQIALRAANQPFDLSKGPLLRGTLIRLTDNDHVLVLALHHICSDDWSMGILLRQLAALYGAKLNGTVQQLATAPIDYADYACWQRAQVDSDAFAADRLYWIEQLADAPAQLALPTDRPRQQEMTTTGGIAQAMIDAETLRGLEKVSRERQVTLFTTLLSAYAVLLGRYSAENDILIGCPIANRERPEVANVVGLFLNTLVLRCRLHDNPNFNTLLKQVNATVLDAFDHQGFPFEQVVDALQPERDLSRNPLFQVMFVLQQGYTLPDFPGLDIERFELQRGFSKFDLTLFAMPRSDGLKLMLEYNADLFDAATIQRMLGHFGRLLRGIVADPNRPIGSHLLLTDAEQQQITVEWNDTVTRYPSDSTIQDLFAAQVARTPEDCALLVDEREWSYRVVEQRANRLAHHLQALGVGPDVPVGVALLRSPQQIVAVLAILTAGGAVVPLDPAYPQARLRVLLDECRPPVLLVHDSTVDNFGDFAGVLVNLDAVALPKAERSPAHHANAESLAYILYTSGSTGKPKGVALPHRALCNLIAWQQSQSRLPIGARTLQLTSLSFDVAFQEIFATLCFGGTLVLTADVVRREPSILLSRLVDRQIERIFLPYVALHNLAEASDRQPTVLPTTLRQVITAGEQLRITPAIGRFFARLPDCTLTNQYGPTETHVATAYTLTGLSDHWPNLPAIGKPIANAKIYLLDDNKQPVPVGVTGEIYIAGDLLARGYWNRPKLTAEQFILHPSFLIPLYKTGDLARYDPDGNLHFLGRADDQVKIRGYRIEPGEVEITLMKHPSVNAAVVHIVGVETDQKRLVAYVTTSGYRLLDSIELRNWLHTQLPDFMIPSAVVVLDEMPLTATGKIDRQRLPTPDRENMIGSGYLAPEDGLEAQLARIWEDVLKVQPVSRNDNFFELGGHSLLAIRLFAEIESRLGMRAPLAALFRAPTVQQLANLLRSQSDSADWSILVPIQPLGGRPPFFCVHGVGGGVLGYAALARHMGLDQPFYGLQAIGLDGVEMPDLTVEAMARRYVAMMRAIQPLGPYHLGGYCFGGLVAFEMARQLTEQGESIAHLAIFEGYAPLGPGGRAIWRRPREWLNFARNLPYWLGDYFEQGSAEFWVAARRRMRMIGKRTGRRFGRNVTINSTDVLGEHMETIPTHARKMYETQIQAQIRYKPQPYSGRVTLYRVKRLSLMRAGDPLMGWGNLSQDGIDVRFVAGSHGTLLEELHVYSLAATLKADLGRKAV